MNTENGKDIARWASLVDQMLQEEDSKKPGPIEKNRSEMDKIQKDILEQKFKLLNAKIKDLYLSKNPEFPENEMQKFTFIDKGDFYEFTIPLNVLFGPKTRKDCANYWDSFFEDCDIKTSFLDNINDSIDKISNIHLTMKLVVKDGKVQEK